MRRYHSRAYLQSALAIILVAVPLLAYANIDASAANPSSYIAETVPTRSVNPATATTLCASQNWPNYSADCVRGLRDQAVPRQIALVTNDVPLRSLPRVIAAPATRQIVVSADPQQNVARPTERRRSADRAMPRDRYAARTEAAARPVAVFDGRVPASW